MTPGQDRPRIPKAFDRVRRCALALAQFHSDRGRIMDKRIFVAALVASGLMAACTQEGGEAVEVAETAPAALEISADSFGCIQDMAAVRGFFVSSLTDELDATLAVANAEEGIYPVGSVVQLVPTEAMVKREEGFSPVSHDWEFFELGVTAEGTTIDVRGTSEAVNRFGGNCLTCHLQAEPQYDLICEQTHGCDPIPVTPLMARAIQKTDPRCEPMALTDEEMGALQALAAMMGGGAAE